MIFRSSDECRAAGPQSACVRVARVGLRVRRRSRLRANVPLARSYVQRKGEEKT